MKPIGTLLLALALLAALGGCRKESGGDRGIPVGNGKAETAPETGEGKEAETAPPKKDVIAGAVEMGREWLIRHQGEDGSWAGKVFKAHCKGRPCEGEGLDSNHDLGLTGLACLALRSASGTPPDPRSLEGSRKAALHLVAHQTKEGLYGENSDAKPLFTHAVCLLALSECLEGSKTPEGLEKGLASLEKGVKYLLEARNPGMAWRYSPGALENDMSVTVWAAMALKSAQKHGVEVPEKVYSDIRDFKTKMTDDETGKVGYCSKGDSGSRHVIAQNWYEYLEAMTGSGLVCEFLCANGPDREAVDKGSLLILNCRPAWKEWKEGRTSTIDMYYWFFGALALEAIRPEGHEAWLHELKETLAARQILDSCARGSWDPKGVWGMVGGRVYSTSMCLLALNSNAIVQRWKCFETGEAEEDR